MNETMSLLLATTILAIGGLGLFMYKSSDDTQNDGDEYNEDSMFGFWGSGSPENEEQEQDQEEDQDRDVVETKVRAKSAAKTKRNRKNVGSKRRY